ncbi:MAG TPA: hypothetical protein VLI90_11335 [Tepidisphaeraceae bacterium]|nr:hypothetical protein [Tepidisphaeraceae bacterium]
MGLETVLKRNRFILLMLVALAMLAGPAFQAAGKPGSPAKTKGSYDFVFAGAVEGDGHGAVAAQSVNIIGKVKDTKTGATSNFNATNLQMDNGRFSGTGTAFGVTVTVNGRVEDADGVTVLLPRVFCTYDIPGLGNGRIVGERKGP